jgi:hypothetical protein
MDSRPEKEQALPSPDGVGDLCDGRAADVDAHRAPSHAPVAEKRLSAAIVAQ